MKVLLVFACFMVYANAVSFYEVVSDEWVTWKLFHGKNFSNPVEDKFRLKIFMENKAKIAKHNAMAHQGDRSYFLKMNSYGDLLHHEFIGIMNGYNFEQKRQLNDGLTQIMPAHVDLPEEVDWRAHGAVTDVKDQGQCGSCWAFSTTGSLEGQHFRKSGRLVSLSEQNLVDCSTKYGNNGCNGGLMDNAFRYIKANGGIDTEQTYPYDGEDEQCHYNPRNIGATDKGFVDVTPGDEDALKAAVATVGPVSVAIDASHPTFQFYNHGIYDEADCDPQNLDHGVLVVGYGTTDEGDYWLVKNSWSPKWGDEGYIKMSRNKNNQCGIASCASYPVV